MKFIRYIIISGVFILIAYRSIYVRKLDEVKASRAAKEFNAAAYAQNYWNTKLLPNKDKAIDLNALSTMLKANADETFASHSHALGIGNLRYILVKGKGIIESVNEDDVTVRLQPEGSKETPRIATEYIFGNAVRDATGLVNINDFSNTMDFNNVSAEINKIIRTRVLPAFKQDAKKGQLIEFIGAIELNREHPDLSQVEVVPIEIKLNQS